MLATIDWIIISLFLLASVAIGIRMRGKQSNEADFFLAKGLMSGFVGTSIIGLSMAATFFSGISFLMYPSLVQSSGLVIYFSIINMIFVYFLVTKFFFPRYVAHASLTPYEILESRFGKATRKTTALLYICMRLGWMAALIYAPTVAILAATNAGSEFFWPIVFTLGLGSTIYASIGGLRGIMIVDALQMLAILVGIGFAIVFTLIYLPVPFSEAFGYLQESRHLQVFNFNLSDGVNTVSVVVGTLFATIGLYLGDQMTLQRYLSAGSVKAVKRTMLVNTIGVLAITGLLACVGLALASWYAFAPDPNIPSSNDQLFPYFIASQLPPGIAGLVIAALLAATMSSMTSGINALCSAFQTDVAPEWFHKSSDRQRVWTARLLSVSAGLFATLLASQVGRLGTIFEITQKLLGLFLGPIAVAFVIAILPVKIKQSYILAGLISGILGGLLVAISPDLSQMFSAYPSINALWTAPISMAIAATIILCGIADKLFSKKKL